MLQRRTLRSLMEPSEAVSRLAALLRDAGFEPTRAMLDAAHAAGCVLAESLHAFIAVPHFPRSIMDGYAVRYQDTIGAGYSAPRRLRLVGRAKIGEYWDRPLGEGEAVEVDTGAGIPPNATAVVPVEKAEERDGWILVYEEVGFGDNVAWPCSDAAPGDVIAPRYTIITPALAAAIAAQGLPGVRVYRPRIAIIPTGVELLEPRHPMPQEPPPGMVYESSSRAVEALLRRCCVDIERYPVIPDDEKEVSRILHDALKAVDMVLFIGGTSAGSEDVVYRVLEREGIVVAHGLKLKPGKPTVMALVDGKPVIGLPGNPASALNVTDKVVTPLLGKVLHAPPMREPRRVRAELLAPAFPARGRHTTTPLILLRGPLEEGPVPALPLACESYMVTCFSKSDAEVVIPAGLHGGLQAGSIVDALAYHKSASRLAVVVSELLAPRTITLLSSMNVKLLQIGSYTAAEALAKKACDVAVVGSDANPNPPPGYKRVDVKRRLVLVRSGAGSTYASYPPSSELTVLYSRVSEAGLPVPANTINAARWLMERGYISEALLTLDAASTINARRVVELEEELTIYYLPSAKPIAMAIARSEAKHSVGGQ